MSDSLESLVDGIRDLEGVNLSAKLLAKVKPDNSCTYSVFHC